LRTNENWSLRTKIVCSGIGSGREREADGRGGGAGGSVERRVLRPERHHLRHREEHERHVHVDVGDERAAGHRGIRGEVLRAEQPALLRGDEQEEHRAARALLEPGEHPRDLEHHGAAERVVVGAVVDAVAARLGAEPHVVEVRRVDEVGRAQRGVAPLEQPTTFGLVTRVCSLREASAARMPSAKPRNFGSSAAATAASKATGAAANSRRDASRLRSALPRSPSSAPAGVPSRFVQRVVGASTKPIARSHGVRVSSAGVRSVTSPTAPCSAASSALRVREA
jgi:hypothetical protein